MCSMGTLAEEGLALMASCKRCFQTYPEKDMVREGGVLLCELCSTFDTVEEAYY